MKNVFDGLISRVDMAKERIFEPDVSAYLHIYTYILDISKETFKTKAKRTKIGKKKKKEQQNIQKCGQNIPAIGTEEKEREKRTEKNI